MASANSECDLTSMFMQRGDGKRVKSPTRSESASRRSSLVKPNLPAEVITVKDFFDFMKTAYQVYEHLEGEEDEGSKINWEELTKLTVLNHVIEQQERDLLYQTAFSEQKTITSKSDTTIEKKSNDLLRVEKRYSCSEIEGRCRRRSLPPQARVEMLGVWTEANLNCKLNDVINEGILDSILPYLVGYKKPSKTTSVYAPIIKSTPPNSSTDVKKPASFGGFVNEKESRDRLGRRKSSVAAGQDRANQKQDGDVEIHVCDEVKGLKKDFRCAQKLLVAKMGYFADVTAGQRLEDMDISVHCDIQIFEWLMRWVKRDSILVADWPLLDAHNVVPILVSASFLQMEPLLHDCLIYCHAHMSDIVNTSTNLACLSDALLTRLAAMYTNAELEAVRDRKDKIQSRLYCKLILALAEPVPETLRGHHASLAALFKCSRCHKLLGRHVAEQVPCQPASMRIDRRGNVVSAHAKVNVKGSRVELERVHHVVVRRAARVAPRVLAPVGRLPLPALPAVRLLLPGLPDGVVLAPRAGPAHVRARGPRAAGRRAPRLLRRARLPLRDAHAEHGAPCVSHLWGSPVVLECPQGCQFREHVPDERLAADAAVAELYAGLRDVIAMRPPQLLLPERLTRLVPRESGDESGGRLQCKEVFWWEGIQLVPPRPPLGLLGKLYTSNSKFNPNARPGSPALGTTRTSAQSLAANCSSGPCASPDSREVTPKPLKEETPKNKPGAGAPHAADGGAGGEAAASDCERSDQSSDSGASDEDAPRPALAGPRPPPPPASTQARRGRAAGRVWLAAQSARSNQDGQRRFEERAAAAMRAALARRHQHAAAARALPGTAAPSCAWRRSGASGTAARRAGGAAPRPPRAATRRLSSSEGAAQETRPHSGRRCRLNIS
ncbi:uncharacterized protein LOC120627868 [Pararge aegeria]|uniref:uncharacterized protein LOC120627868 n=1 Tax=Pararge aegeria TaxID=116150 RepID=UPI0019D1B67B|nr:uncharacterized protein LOC120627868 [Pararge aegeria]